MGAFLQNKGGYRKLRVYQVTVMIHDMTYYFANRYFEKGDRTIDQMIQAARSGKQNIAEGSEASTTSRETEIKLTNVAKASLEELLIDYEDYLRHHHLQKWSSDHPRYANLRDYASGGSIDSEYAVLITKLNDEELANLCITLIHQATYMLRKLIAKQQQQFLLQGGIREQMTQARIQFRSQQQNSQSLNERRDNGSGEK